MLCEPTLMRVAVPAQVRRSVHVEIRMKEVFGMATTQLHLKDMTADLRTLLHEHFVGKPIGDPQYSFKRLILNKCQASFEANLKPPSEL